MNKYEIVVYNKGVDFEFLSNFYLKHFLFEVFWCSNSRYNGSHVSICAYEVRKHFDLTFMRMNECEIVQFYNKPVDFEILSNFVLPRWALISHLSITVDVDFSSWIE